MKNSGIPVFFVFVIVILFGSVLLILSFQNTIRNAKSKKVKGHSIVVATSFYPLYYFASRIGGDKAIVYNITPAGVEPHEYEPTPLQIAEIQQSDLLIINGAGFEAWAEKLRKTLSEKQTAVIAAGEKLATETQEGRDRKDPHVWLSPPLAQKEVRIILEAFVRIDPTHMTYYKNNANILIGELDYLHIEYKNGLSQCKKKDIITSHFAFGYLAKTYGLNQVTIHGISPDDEPSAKKLSEIVQFAKKNTIQYIFFEKLASPKLSDTIAREAHAKTLVLDPLEGLSETDIKQGRNYLTVMRDNLTNLRKALECM